MGAKVLVKTYDGVGGPATPKRNTDDGFEAGPTDPGQYIVAYCGKHSSQRYAAWSRIPWGSKLKDVKGELYVLYQGRWTLLRTVTTVTREEILDMHENLYGSRLIPSTWVFNDFGHMTCYYFKDVNQNGRKDTSERIHGEFIHTTPPDEANTALGNDVILVESHGCIHVKPVDIDEMRQKGYLKKGNKIVIHKYTESLPVHLPKAPAKEPYELHFYPGVKKILVEGLRK
jgi:hypothetical protein